MNFMTLNPSPQKIFSIFRKNYRPVPLELFGKNPYKTLVSTLLSARTKDTTTLQVSNKLFSQAPSIKKLNNLTIKELENLIHPIGFYKTKARHLKKLSDKILMDHGGNIPSDRESLITLPGVGRKTANLVLNRAFGIAAIAVDTHVHRICNLIGWVDTKSPGQTEKELTKILPKKYWTDINHLFVSIGQQYNSKQKLNSFLKKNGLIDNG
jgi:endonuclease III